MHRVRSATEPSNIVDEKNKNKTTKQVHDPGKCFDACACERAGKVVMYVMCSQRTCWMRKTVCAKFENTPTISIIKTNCTCEGKAQRSARAGVGDRTRCAHPSQTQPWLLTDHHSELVGDRGDRVVINVIAPLVPGAEGARLRIRH